MIRHGEIHLKGKNKNFFESLLIKNVRERLSGVTHSFTHKRSRYIVSKFSDSDEKEILSRLSTVFGIHSYSLALQVSSTLKDVEDAALLLSKKKGTFRINSNRADKRFPLNSMQLNAHIGGVLLDKYPDLKVELRKPDFSVNIDIREDGGTYVYSDSIMGAGGLPVGCSGKGLLLLSGGIDSPVAGYMMAKRGMSIDALHFHSYPYTSEQAKQKVIKLSEILSGYLGSFNLICVPFAKVQEEIYRKCDSKYTITMLRCFMMRVAERVALKRSAGCIINGESLGQVASQTLESIYATNYQVEKLPVFRPLIGMDKSEIIEVSRKIDTYETSILPYEDCCTVFLPDNPVTRPSLKNVEQEINKIPNLEELLTEALDNLEIIKIV